MYKVSIISDYGFLPESLKNEYETNWFDDGMNVLVVEHNGHIVEHHIDHSEPEDNSFIRDYRWIQTSLYAAYEAGRQDILRQQEQNV